MFGNGDYENMEQQMAEDLLDYLPAKGSSQLMTREELEDYLIEVKFRDFTGSSSTT